MFAFLFAIALPAQKAFKPVRAQLKAKNGAQAMKLIQELEKDTTVTDKPKLYDMGKQAQILLNAVENEKAYLKQAYDTAQLFKTTLGIYDYILKCEQEEQRILAETGKSMKYHKDNGEVLIRYYRNLSAGGRFFYKKGDYASAMKYLRYSLDVPFMPIWGGDRKVTQSQNYTDNAKLFTRSAYFCKNYEDMERYAAVILADTSQQRRSTLEFLALGAEGRNDSIRYYNLLLQGWHEYPSQPFFFTHLADFLQDHKDYKTMLELASLSEHNDTLHSIALEAKSIALLNLKRYEEAIETAKANIAADSAQTDAYYYVGAAYCKLAAEVELPVNINSSAYRSANTQRKDYYKNAMPFLEHYRKAKPEAIEKWGPLLYRIYFTLNMGKAFDEIDKLMKAAKAQDGKK